MEEMLDNPVVFLSLFVAAWVSVCYLLSYTGDWCSLSKRYRIGATRFSGERWYMQIGAMSSGTRYGGMLTVGADSGGLYLAVLFLFRIGHPPLYIPWADIDIYQEHRRFREYTVFEFKAIPETQLRVSQKLGEQIARAGRQLIASTHAMSAQ